MAQKLEHDAIERPGAIPWPPILIVVVVVAAWLLGRAMPIDWPGLDDAAARFIGLGLGVAGLLLFVWAAVTLRRHGTTILPDCGASRLVTDGPYAFRRNPIYLAHVLILLGVAEATKNIWFVAAAAVYAVLVTQLAILPEERHLEAKFGDAYRAWAEKTRRWI